MAEILPSTALLLERTVSGFTPVRLQQPRRAQAGQAA